MRQYIEEKKRFAADLHEYFIDVEGIAITLVLALQSAGIKSAELDTPEAYRFSGHSDASLGKKVFNITMAEVKSVVEPDCVGDDVRRESVTFICAHPLILTILDS